MKKISTIILLLLVSFCFVLSGCGSKPLTMPENYESTVSNGGFVVGAGNYMYFANAYKEASSITNKSENEGDGVAQFSLKRVKVSQNNKGLSIERDENGDATYENVVNKIAGFEISKMYIVKDYLYFASPNIHKNKQNEHEFNLTTLFKIKLDGTGLTEVFTSNSEAVDMYLTSDKQLVVFDNSKILLYNLAAENTNGRVIASGVESVVFPDAEEQELTWLYFTAEREDTDNLFTGNVLKKVSVKDGNEVIECSKVSGVTINIVDQSNGVVFYKKSSSSSGYVGVFSYDGEKEIHHRTLTEGIDDKGDLLYVQAKQAEQNCFVFIYKDNLYVQYMSACSDNLPKDDAGTKITSDKTTIHFANGNYVYYSTENGIYRYSVLEKTQKQISDHKNIQSNLIDYDGRYVYYFVKADGQETETQYLYRADSFAEQIKTERIAVLTDADANAESEEK